ncbi:MAG: tripartite tricarboxylate transporter TctB family protein [Betaproteobacteria bacterium]|nr:MAG: tripartite tricarboxylate transporter TctB family protein [Betaproteobacteria bacterium]TAG50006.1 MAG: tripartite tricarboxylate transporter TctB family protein [Betaproteobacteria bacterium]
MTTKIWQVSISCFILALALVFGLGVSGLPTDAGYAGISSRFVPILITVFLAVVGALLLWQSLTGGFRHFFDDTANVRADLRGVIWVSAGILLMALLISYIGFVLSAAVLFVCTARGFGSRALLRDLAIGVALVLPVYWLFGQVLAVSLPKLFNQWL